MSCQLKQPRGKILHHLSLRKRHTHDIIANASIVLLLLAFLHPASGDPNLHFRPSSTMAQPRCQTFGNLQYISVVCRCSETHLLSPTGLVLSNNAGQGPTQRGVSPLDHASVSPPSTIRGRPQQSVYSGLIRQTPVQQKSLRKQDTARPCACLVLHTTCGVGDSGIKSFACLLALVETFWKGKNCPLPP